MTDYEKKTIEYVIEELDNLSKWVDSLGVFEQISRIKLLSTSIGIMEVKIQLNRLLDMSK